MSGTKGAPIYEDYAKGKENIEENPKAKEGLLTQKIISIASMIGVSLLSMMKMVDGYIRTYRKQASLTDMLNILRK